jgi:uncharacterized protein (DUF58 family)
MSRIDATHALPGARFIDPHVLSRIGNLEMLASVVVEGFINGLHRSPNLGASMDFAEHRSYMPGDDIRRIDWKLFARSDRYYIKEFEADTNANFSVLLDVSKSMNYSGKPGQISKLEYAKYLTACLAYFSHGQRDRVGLVTFDNDVVEYVPPSAKHLNVILHTLDRMKPGGKGEIGLPMRKLSESFRRRSMIAIVSDFYTEPELILDAITRLRGKGNDLMLFHVLDNAEVEFPFENPVNFMDMESDERLPVIPANFREKYKSLIAAHIEALGRTMREHRIDYTLLDTSKPLDDALFAFLSNRERLSRVR